MFHLMMQKINILADKTAQFKSFDVDINLVRIHSYYLKELHFSHEQKFDNKSNF